MLNKSTSRSEYTVQYGVTPYPVGFTFYYNGDDTPQIRVTIGDMVAEENKHFVISEDLLTINLIPLEEEAPVDPNDYSWMNKWVGMPLVIERAIPLVQESDYHLGRISPERIEKDFDLSVMRDQVLDVKIDDARDELQSGIDDKLPLSGGTLTGPLTIMTDESTYDVLRLETRSGKSYRFAVLENGMQMQFDIYATRNISPSGKGKYELGDWLHPWGTVYTNKINYGEFGAGDIIVPQKAGTIALLEDVEGKADKTELSNYLPLAGGNLLGQVFFDMGGAAGKNTPLIGVKTASGMVPLVGAKTDDNGVLRDVAVIPKLQSETLQGQQIYSSFIGTPDNPVTRIHAKKIGAGSMTKLLTIPEGPGTLARLEDVQEVDNKLAGKQDQLKAGDNIIISGNVISATGAGGGAGLDFIVVQELPETGQKGVVYLLAKDGAAPDVYDEYVWINAAQTFELIGSTKVDLSDYAKKEDLSNYLPLSGGTMTDTLSFDVTGSSYTFVPIIVNAEGKGLISAFADSTGRTTSTTVQIKELRVDELKPARIGGVYDAAQHIYVAKIGSGKDGNLLNVPDGAGTLARLEDLENIDALPDQTGSAGKVLMTDGTTASWQEPAGGTKVIFREWEE